MIAVAALSQFMDMQIMGVHPSPNDGVTLELGMPGRPGIRRWVTIETTELLVGGIAVTEAVDPPAARYRNRRGYTDAPTLAQHHIDQGDDRAERDRELTDWCDL